MNDDLTATTSDPRAHLRASPGTVPWWAVVVCWSRDEPARVGEVAFVPPRRELVLGRGTDGEAPRVAFGRHRPSGFTPTGPLTSPRLSREQLRLRATDAALEVTRLGRRTLTVDGRPCEGATVGEGAVIEIDGELVLWVGKRPMRMALAPAAVDEGFAFGGPDGFGLVGEGPIAWRLRSEVRFAGPRAAHVLLLGPTGSGKELVARALHACSGRAGRPWVARNASTLPPSLIEAELFGHARGYPQAGMPERTGLVGEADGTTLFLDEIGEMPVELQARLLRVMDGDGEYQRLGETRQRRADLRIIAATNRPVSALKHDLVGRFGIMLEVPPLAARREDIPLLLAHRFRALATEDPDLRRRFGTADGLPRLAAGLVSAMLTADLPLNAREVDTWLWRALPASTGDVIEAPRVVATPDERPREPVGPTSSGPPPTADEITAALRDAGGVVSRAWQSLGLPSRFALYRRMRELGVSPDDTRD